MTDLVEEDPLRPAGSSPPRNRTIAAVGVHLHLREEHCKDRTPDPGNQKTAGDAPAREDHQTGASIGTDRRADEQHREIERDMTQMELSRPVLRVLSAADLDRLCLGPKLRQSRVFS